MGGSPRGPSLQFGWAAQTYAAQVIPLRRKQAVPIIALAVVAAVLVWLEVRPRQPGTSHMIATSAYHVLLGPVLSLRRRLFQIILNSQRTMTTSGNYLLSPCEMRRQVVPFLTVRLVQWASSRTYACQLAVARLWYPCIRRLLRSRPTFATGARPGDVDVFARCRNKLSRKCDRCPRRGRSRTAPRSQRVIPVP
jgi:hypothetical protein